MINENFKLFVNFSISESIGEFLLYSLRIDNISVGNWSSTFESD